LLLCTISLTNTQWVSNYGVSSGDVNFTNAKGTAITCDAAGNSYVTGYSYENESQNDIITIKYTPAGDTAWVRSFNGDANLNDEGNGICVDNAGNVYVVGFAEFNG
ncbi:MAG TPA: SBBP repeat-containing protein, partial [Ignavibacteria bacterium]|nr:SBBP repeat-containing protein [Ignavibacteria bacterium]